MDYNCFGPLNLVDKLRFVNVKGKPFNLYFPLRSDGYSPTPVTFTCRNWSLVFVLLDAQMLGFLTMSLANKNSQSTDMQDSFTCLIVSKF